MSNLELKPAEVACESRPDGRPGGSAPVQVLTPRLVPLGGPRAMTVRRTLPQRSRSLIGAWCFLDHYGPDDVAATGGMQVAGHPHTGLQTVSWLFRGEIEHRDTTGVHALVRPGELNLMTAGSGIAHSEYSTPATTLLHGVQLWVALPGAERFTGPGFEHFTPPAVDVDGSRLFVFLGTLAGQASPVRTFSPLVGAQLEIPAGAVLDLPVDPSFEHGVLLDAGRVRLAGAGASGDDPTGDAPTAAGADAAGVVVAAGELAYLPIGTTTLHLSALGSGPARLLLIGGEPLGERIVMWWNFVGRSHEEIVGFREQWQAERSGRLVRDRRFGAFPGEWDHTLPAPVLPNIRLRPRE